MSDGFPSSPPPPPPATPIITSGRAWWQSWWLITALSVILIVGAAALITSTTGGDDDSRDTARPAPTEPSATEPSTTEPAATDPGASVPATDETGDDTTITPPPVPADGDGDPDGDGDEATTTDPASPPATEPPSDEDRLVAGAPGGARGDRTSPVAPGEIADIGDGWRLQVLDVVEDGTLLVLAENQFNDAPRANTKFTLVDVALGYYGLDDPANAFIPTISGVAAASVELDEDCGVIPNDFRRFSDVFSGGVVVGTLCFVTTPPDDGTILLFATTGFAGPDVFLAASTPAAPPQMPTLAGPQPDAAATPARLDPIPIGTPVDVGEGWTFTVTGPAADITDVVAAENQFNDPPPEGYRFVGLPLEYRYDGAGAASAFEVTTRVVGNSNVDVAKGCGVIPDPVDTFADVFAGGAVAGSLCFTTPVGDVGSLVLYTSTSFDGETVYFATDDGGGASAG